MTLSFEVIRSGPGHKSPPLAENDIHVWGVALNVDDGTASSLGAYLSADERQRAERLISPERRREFIAAHGALRAILSRYADERPEDLRFGLGKSGKPYLDTSGTSAPIRFNLTHSQGRALVAVASQREVGIDLEWVRREVDITLLARRFFSPSDIARLEAAEPPERHAVFCRLWVVREAVCKAEGTGIRFPLHRDHVDLSPSNMEGRLVCDGKPGSVLARLLSLESGWIGAVAAEGRDWRVTLCR